METGFTQRVHAFCSFLTGEFNVDYDRVLNPSLECTIRYEWAWIVVPRRWWFPRVVAQCHELCHHCYGKISEEKILFVRIKDLSVLSKLEKAAHRYSEEMGGSVVII